MMNRWLKGVAVVALMVVGTVAAQAADLPTRKEAPAASFHTAAVHLDRVLHRFERRRHLEFRQS